MAKSGWTSSWKHDSDDTTIIPERKIREVVPYIARNGICQLCYTLPFHTMTDPARSRCSADSYTLKVAEISPVLLEPHRHSKGCGLHRLVLDLLDPVNPIKLAGSDYGVCSNHGNFFVCVDHCMVSSE